MRRFTARAPTRRWRLQRDLEFVEHLDALGFDEVWIGEHHSAGSEIISSPEVFIAAAAERAKRIRFGTGVISLSYHNPLWVADRLMLLDHLTHGRIIGGMGPGSLPTDSAMIGLTPTDTRELLETNLDIVVRLLAGETVSAKTPTHELFDAQLQLAPYSDGGIPLAVAGVASPTGARLAGKHGIGLLSIGATLVVEGFDALAYHWGIVEERAAAFGTNVDRKNWTLVGPFHIAETDEQARADVKFGIESWFRYFQKVAAFPQMTIPGDQTDAMIDIINDAGAGVIGTSGARARPGAAAVGPVRRVRLHAADGARMGKPVGHQAIRGTVRRRSDAPFPGPGRADARGGAARQRGARGPGQDAAAGHRPHDEEVPGRSRQPIAVGVVIVAQVQQDGESCAALDQRADRAGASVPRMRSPSQCPGTARSSTSAGRSLILIPSPLLYSRPARMLPRDLRAARLVYRPCSDQRAGSPRSAHTGTCRSFRGSLVPACHQGDRVPTSPLSASGSTRHPSTLRYWRTRDCL